jgi:hypothetical protein
MAKTKLTLPVPKKMVHVPDMPPPPEVDQRLVEAVIDKGGTVASEKKPILKPESDPLKSFTIRIYQSELNRIKEQQALMRKRDRLSIEAYILNAIEEKLAKDEKKSNRQKG